MIAGSAFFYTISFSSVVYGAFTGNYVQDFGVAGITFVGGTFFAACAFCFVKNDAADLAARTVRRVDV